MLPTSERERPHIARARWVSSRMDRVSPSASWLTTISSATVQASWPLGPFTVTCWPSTVTVTPLCTGMGFFPIRDISVDPAEHFAANVLVARGGVAHDPFRGGQDRDPE